MSYTNNDENNDFQEQEDPHVARIYSVLEASAQDVKLATRADSVVIVITRHHKDGRTESFASGIGNHYARLESVREYLHKQSGD